ncbi:hypothetical protein EJ066_01445 [Mesorhizobium sp. M9A.F.Ca.ET.002.03.1.2]|uniref:hypothetical protein n=1 Tax=Mesorhizobium sp. M9A.F.Ca.ET.002.03.1.2 TaxID=2493668 RepID=UPI000F7528C9|nr:hypothetical protein [Mesorhizobium sp. M9A.F.Ca.ET.002.03.1.2]AZN96069.1 hypothetical protein EJ066_01445 [Mesorhizobium sp. M9A.F.Ca.ET.002.03.1.2]
MKFASSWDNTAEPLAGARTEPVFGDCKVAVIGATSSASMLVQTPPEQVQTEMPIWRFFSEVPAAQGPFFGDSAETEQSNWLEQRSHPS